MWRKFQSWKVVGFSNLPQFLQVKILFSKLKWLAIIGMATPKVDGVKIDTSVRSVIFCKPGTIKDWNKNPWWSSFDSFQKHIKSNMLIYCIMKHNMKQIVCFNVFKHDSEKDYYGFLFKSMIVPGLQKITHLILVSI